MEGELFRYAKGAFSGAVRDYDGLVMAGEGGTVFLDEIDDTPYALQVKLLRVLEDRMVSRLGESIWHKVNFRAVAATNRDLRALIAQGTFGADLHERLSTLEIHLPPLRERSEDLPDLRRQAGRSLLRRARGLRGGGRGSGSSPMRRWRCWARTSGRGTSASCAM